MLKILSGTYRSRSLLSPPDSELTRPYLGRVRESVFGMLHAWFEDANVLDLFSGVGTVGLEAISRGARHAVMVESSRRVHELMVRNVETLGCADRAVAVLGDALGSACLARAERPVHLAFIDPPFAMMRDEASRGRIMTQAARVRPLMGGEGFLVLRSPLGPRDADLAVPGFEGPEEHRYRGDQWVLLYAPGAGQEHDGA